MDYSRLSAAVQTHFKRLEPHRKSREQLIRHAAGSGYPNNKIRKEILNLLRQAADAMAITLAASNPRCLVTTHDPQLRGFADQLSRTLDRYAERSHLQETLEEFARAAFYGLGVVKCFRGDSPAVVWETDEWCDPGYPCCLNVSQDNLCWDTTATDMHRCSFVTDRYPVIYDHLVNDVRFSSKVRKSLKDKGRSLFINKEGASTISMRDPSDDDEWLQKVWLADVFIPTEGKILTYPVDSDFSFCYPEPIAEQQWKGGETGPYHYLNLGPVVDNSYPSAPGQGLIRLHELVNSNYKKLEQQAKDMKEVNIVQGGSEDDAEKIKNAENGSFPVLQNVGAVIKARYGGPDQNLFAFTLNAMELFSDMGGNVKKQLGTDAGADTLGQDQMLSAAVGSVRGFYQSRFMTAVRGIFKELGRLIWTDKVNEIPGSISIPGTSIQGLEDTWLPFSPSNPPPQIKIPGTNPPKFREMTLDDLDIGLVPFSNRDLPPEARSQKLTQTFQEILAGAQFFAMNGDYPNPRKYLEMKARYDNMPEYLDLLTSHNQPMEMGGGGSGMGHQAQGEYIHRSVSGGQGEDMGAQALSMMTNQDQAA